MEDPKKGARDEVKKGLGEDGPKKGVGEDGPKNEGEEGPKESKVGVTRPLSDLFLTPNLPDGFFLLVFWTMSFLSPPLMPEDLGVSAMSFRMELKIELDSITPDAVVISSVSLSVIFSLFFMKSVNIWNRSFSDIL